MDRNLAEITARTLIKSCTVMTDLVPLLKENCMEDEYKLYAKLIAKSAADVHLDILNKIYNEHPDIKDKFEALVDRFGQV